MLDEKEEKECFIYFSILTYSVVVRLFGVRIEPVAGMEYEGCWAEEKPDEAMNFVRPRFRRLRYVGKSFTQVWSGTDGLSAYSARRICVLNLILRSSNVRRWREEGSRCVELESFGSTSVSSFHMRKFLLTLILGSIVSRAFFIREF